MTFHKSQHKKVLTEVYLGKQLTVVNSSDVSKVGVKGRVLDETKNLFVIDINGKKKKIPKKECVFELEGYKGFEIDGKDICYNIADRIKKYA